MLRDQRHAGLGDAGLFPGDPRHRIARRARLFGQQERLVIDPQRGDPADGGCGDDVGGIEPTAKPDLDDAGIRRGARKRQERGGGGDLEKARTEIARGTEDLLEQCRQQRIVDQRSRQPDALVEAHQMRAGIDVHAAPVRLQHGPQKGAGPSPCRLCPRHGTRVAGGARGGRDAPSARAYCADPARRPVRPAAAPARSAGRAAPVPPGRKRWHRPSMEIYPMKPFARSWFEGPF